jgi:hypothetical protein
MKLPTGEVASLQSGAGTFPRGKYNIGVKNLDRPLYNKSNHVQILPDNYGAQTYIHTCTYLPLYFSMV